MAQSNVDSQAIASRPSPVYDRETGASAPDQQFQNHDDPRYFPHLLNKAKDFNTKNFVVKFGDCEARTAFNLESEDVSTLLTKKAIGDVYGFSPRLQGLMCEPHPNLGAKPEESTRSHIHFPFRRPARLRFLRQDPDEETGIPMEARLSGNGEELNLGLNHYQIVDEVWHFMSVDPGEKCYNSLQEVQDPKGDESENESRPDFPNANHQKADIETTATVITIQENPFPHHRGALSEPQEQILEVTRRNLLNVFKQLSDADESSSMHELQNPLLALPIRHGLPVSRQSNHNGDAAAKNKASLLFYYLFDDWFSSYGLVARREHQYGTRLEILRKEMSNKPDLDHINRLHTIGRQLGVLKRIYKSYELIIDRILERQQLLISNTVNIHSDSNLPNGATPLSHQPSGSEINSEIEPPTLGVLLSSAAIVRFERLRDRIRLYALSEIQDCLDEKESLVFLNFNLIGLKESQAVERLTRITILLAKGTLLFLPVSLMTGYFSVQITDLEGVYTAKTYWICFAVILALSAIALSIFGLISDTVEGKIIYRSMSQMLFDISKIPFRRAKKKAS
ncbi:MAG: hypothetical protein M1834_008111 [Cirrosporium novae-zelandiae]|nr:MAG: hypothetical protein M1834_008111 [Cirrosporium novae-zelandiae]